MKKMEAQSLLRSVLFVYQGISGVCVAELTIADARTFVELHGLRGARIEIEHASRGEDQIELHHELEWFYRIG